MKHVSKAPDRSPLLRKLALPILASLLVSCAPAATPRTALLPAGAHYVAMGSSFAAGPGVGNPAESPTDRCSRSAANYAQQLARKRDLHLTDVSCGGATTAHVLGAWNELPAQVDALRPNTALVTVTIGGNDVGYIGGLMAGSCEAAQEVSAAAPICRAMAARGAASDPEARSRALSAPSEEAWQKVEAGLDQIAQEVRLRSPRARLMFVDYLTVLPEDGLCPQTPLSPRAAATARVVASRLAETTAAAARRAGAELVRASELSESHNACASEPWMTGFLPSGGASQFVPYHPNLAGMTAVADAVDRQLGR